MSTRRSIIEKKKEHSIYAAVSVRKEAMLFGSEERLLSPFDTSETFRMVFTIEHRDARSHVASKCLSDGLWRVPLRPVCLLRSLVQFFMRLHSSMRQFAFCILIVVERLHRVAAIMSGVRVLKELKYNA